MYTRTAIIRTTKPSVLFIAATSTSNTITKSFRRQLVQRNWINQLAITSSNHSYFITFSNRTQQTTRNKWMSSTAATSAMSNNSSNGNSSDLLRPVQASMERKLKESLKPIYLQIINESSKHNVPLNAETHFKVLVVSEQFTSVKTLIDRHRMVNDILRDELTPRGSVHALSIIAKTPTQWECMQNKSPDGIVTIEPSPACKGGDGSLPKKR